MKAMKLAASVLLALSLCNQTFAGATLTKSVISELAGTTIGKQALSKFLPSLRGSVDAEAILVQLQHAPMGPALESAITRFAADMTIHHENASTAAEKALGDGNGGVVSEAELTARSTGTAITASSVFAESKSDKINGFTERMMKGIIDESNGTDNLFIPGPALMSATAMLVNAANEGQPRSELLKLLGYKDTQLDAMNELAADMVATFNAKRNDVTSRLANAFFSNDGFELVPSYVQAMKKHFNATVSTVPFTKDPKVAAETINTWASDNTEKMIKEIINEDTASKLATIMATAVYFKGTWKHQYDKEKTYQAAFMLGEDKHVMVDMMHNTVDLKGMARHDLPYVIAELPYDGDGMAMYAIMPTIDWQTRKPKMTPEQALLEVMNKKTLNAFTEDSDMGGIQEFKEEDIAFPKLNLKYTNKEVKKVYERAGIQGVFTNGNMLALSPDPRLRVVYIRIDSALVVNEEGTEAAGVASIGSALESMRQAPFEFNRPFAIVIRDKKTGVDRFSGVIHDPSKE